MATILSHGIAALALGKGFTGERMPIRFWVASVVCAMLPDVDVVGFALGIHYGDMLGDRGLTHSLFFALLTGVLVVLLLFGDWAPRAEIEAQRETERPGRYRSRFRTWLLILYFFIVTSSHGVLDALTNGGLGVAFFAPFSNTRYFFPWTPIEVSPIGLRFVASNRALTVIVSEIVWIWIPSALVIAVAWMVRKIARPDLK